MSTHIKNYKHSAIPSNSPSGSMLVLDGGDVKLRLLAERQASKSVVHVDWVRFTSLRRNASAPSADLLWPKPEYATWLGREKKLLSGEEFKKILGSFADSDFSASVQAYELACEVAQALGPDFSVSAEFKKGMDFYRFRWSIERFGSECGWVGFLASGESPRQQSQSATIHCNLYGAACTFATPGWNFRVADIVDANQGTLTRCDLALDFFDGLPGGLDGIVAEYKSGVCDVGGKRLKSNCVGDWLNGHERSLYFGSKEAGKQTNVYEKGDQLFGIAAASLWLRAELRYGNKLRVLCSDMLRRPADFFAGASDWHGALLLKADAIVSPQEVPTVPRLQLETVEAECTRNVRWMVQTAASSLAVACQHLDFDQVWELIGSSKLPGRLRKFSPAEIKRSFDAAFARVVSGPALVLVPGTTATYSISTVEGSPAFA